MLCGSFRGAYLFVVEQMGHCITIYGTGEDGGHLGMYVHSRPNEYK